MPKRSLHTPQPKPQNSGFIWMRQPTLCDEELLRKITEHAEPYLRSRLEEIFDRADEDNINKSIDDAVEHSEEQWKPYETAWDEIFEVWQAVGDGGHWPARSPSDPALQKAICDDIRKWARAFDLIKTLPEDMAAQLMNQLIDEGGG